MFAKCISSSELISVAKISRIINLSCQNKLQIRYVHSQVDKESFLPDPYEQWFQYRLYPEGDVCNFYTCNHEMWILFLVFVSVACVLAGIFA